MATSLNAFKSWNKIDEVNQNIIINNVFCRNCMNTTIVDYEVHSHEAGIVLQGNCKNCNDSVVRLVEQEWYEEPSDEEDDYELYEKAVKLNRKKIKNLLDAFDLHLTKMGLSDKTITNHIGNIHFYLDAYLNYYEATPPEDGVYMVAGFLGDWFVRKAMWSSPTSVKANAASLKKFYKFMLEETDLVSKEDYQNMCSEIKEDLPDWVENARTDNDWEVW